MDRGDVLRLREEVVGAFRLLEERGLNYGRSGNVSVRLGGGMEGLFLVSPSGARKSALRPEDLLVVDRRGEVVEGRGRPSSEVRMHLAVYGARDDVNAVVHAHPIHAGALAALGLPLPPILEELVIYVGGGVEVAEYAPTGTEELARNAVGALGDRNAAILANHGVLAVGADLEEAIDSLIYVERAAHAYLLALAAGRPRELPREAVERERAAFLSRRSAARPSA